MFTVFFGLQVIRESISGELGVQLFCDIRRSFVECCQIMLEKHESMSAPVSAVRAVKAKGGIKGI